MKDLTQGNELKQIAFFTLPMLAGNIFQQLYNVVDSIVVGRAIGDHALAAVGMSFPVFFIFLSFIIGFAMASNILIAQCTGAGDTEAIYKVVQTSIIMLFWSSLAVTIAGYYAAPFILQIMNAPADTFIEAVTYLRIIFLGMLFMFMSNGFTALLRGLGDSVTPVYALLISTVVNIILDCVFVIVFKWGIAGAGYATLIAQGSSCVWLILYARKKYTYFCVNYLRLSFDKAMCIKTLKIGLPSSIQQVLVGGGFIALSSIVNTFGTQTAAAYSAAGKLDGLIVMPAMNLSIALASFTGQNIGAKRLDRVKRGLRASLGLGLSLSALTAGTLLFFRYPVMKLFADNPAVIEIGVRYFLLVCPAYFFNTVTFVLNGVIRGAGKTVFPMISTLLAMWLFRIPAAALFSLYWGTDGIWGAVTVGTGAGMLLTSAYYLHGRWRKQPIA